MVDYFSLALTHALLALAAWRLLLRDDLDHDPPFAPAGPPAGPPADGRAAAPAPPSPAADRRVRLSGRARRRA